MVVTALAVLAVLGALVATYAHPVRTPDSVTYEAGAANLADGEGYTDVDGRPVTLFAPGLPLVLAPAEAVGIEGARAARLLNAFLYGALVVLGWRLARRHLASRWLAVGVAGALAVSPAVLMISTRVWSEPLFLVLTVAALAALEWAAASRVVDRGALALAGALTGMAALTRYQGVVLIAAGALALAVTARHRGRRDAAVRVGLFTAVAVIAPMLWAARNLSLGTGPFGPRGEAIDRLPDTWSRFTRVLTEWLVPSDVVGPEPPPARLLALVGLAGLLAGAALVHRSARTPRRSIAQPPPGAPAWSLTPLVCQVGVASSWMVTAGAVTPLNPLDTRLLILVYPSLVLLVAWSAETLVRAAPFGRPRRFAIVASGALALLWVAASGVRWASEVRGARQACCFTEAALASSFHHEVLARPDDLPVFSDQPDALWLVERGTYRWLPARAAFRSAAPIDERPQFAHDVACAGGAWAAWYGTGRTWLFEPAELTGHVRVDPPPVPGEQGVYRVSPLPGTPTPSDC